MLSASRSFCYHDLVLVMVVFVLTLVVWVTVKFLFSSERVEGQLNSLPPKNESLEFMWGVNSVFLLFSIGFIFLVNPYYLNLAGDPINAFSMSWHQWHWEYMHKFSFTELGESKMMGMGMGISEMLKERKEFEGMYKSITLENAMPMLSFVQGSFNIWISGVAAVSPLEELFSEMSSNFNSLLVHSFMAGKLIWGNFSQQIVLAVVSPLALEGDKSMFNEWFYLDCFTHSKNFWTNCSLSFINQKSKRVVFEFHMALGSGLFYSANYSFWGFYSQMCIILVFCVMS